MAELLNSEMPVKKNPNRRILLWLGALLLSGLAIGVIVLVTGEDSYLPQPKQNTQPIPRHQTEKPPLHETRKHDSENDKQKNATEESSRNESDQSEIRIDQQHRSVLPENPEQKPIDPGQQRLSGSVSTPFRETRSQSSQQPYSTVVAPGNAMAPDYPTEMRQDVVSRSPSALLPDNLAIGLIEPREVRWPAPESPKPDFLKSSAKAHNPPETREKRLQFGLQWSANVPITSGNRYVDDLKVGQGASLLAIPAVWMAYPTSDKNEVALEVRPVFDYFTGNSLFYEFSNQDSTSNYRQEEARLLKTTSSSIALLYRHQIVQNLWLGAGFAYHHHWRAAATVRQGVIWGGGWGADSVQTFGRSDDYWPHIRSSNIAASADLSYQLKSFRIGGSLLLPVLPPGTGDLANKRPLNGQFFIRWRIR